MERVPLATTTGAMSWAGVLRTTGPERRGHQRSQALPLCPLPAPSQKGTSGFKHALKKNSVYIMRQAPFL